MRNVKESIAPKLGLKPEEVKIIFAGKELGDTIKISECDLGQQSILHAVKNKKKVVVPPINISEEIIEEGSKPLCETLGDFAEGEVNDVESQHKTKAHFYVFCPTCKSLKTGKLRVRCHFCKIGAFTVHSDPQSWNDVLEPKRITGTCENSPELCENILNNREPTFAQFYFKCSEHISSGENDEAVPLYLIRPNLKEIPCLACGDIIETVFVFPCAQGHVACLDCFRQYCLTRLRERQFWQHPEYGYTLGCPIGCPDSFISEIHHFKLLTQAQYDQYQTFATEEFVLQSGGVLCPQPGCGMGILVDPGCNKVACVNGCGYVFCRMCLQGYHIGSCLPTNSLGETSSLNCNFDVDPKKVSEARWDEASKVTIKVLTKPCPKCRTPTERDGGCMHMICTRSGCNFHWCWVCQTEWTRECMSNHWFG
ncbi:E3 ubiquitin-protein ligase parkin [Agrilus planipennis]|uniref:E3 ubiquitin-protein ligase parkin n=1 Tax=Agrilus planipennis TaxID=224129 RepID=A0A1W4XBH3_AGRPL|nr:E3 ubiquitin-protein ligase parkin [Agrilus planipennis]